MLFVPKDWLFTTANLFLLSLLCSFPLRAQDSTVHRGPMALPPDTTLDTVKSVVHSPLISDSLYSVLTQTATVLREPVFFAPHELKVREIRPDVRFSRQKEWAFVILFICILLLAWTRYYFKKRLRQVFQAFLSARYYNQLIRAGDVYNERLAVNLFLIFVLLIPLLMFEVNLRFPMIPVPDTSFGNLLLYGFFLLVSLVLYGLKMLSLQVSGQIFKTYELTSEYVLTHYIFNLMEGLMLIPLLILLVFAGSDLVLGLIMVVLAAAFLYRLVRGLMIGLKESKYNLFYMLTFFISIEILPILVLFKLSGLLRTE